MRLLLIVFVVAIGMTSCFRKRHKEIKPEIIYANNAELDEWASAQTIKKSDNAHSGKFVSVIDSINPYSLGITKPLSEISIQTPDSVTFTYWVFMKDLNSTVTTVFSIEDAAGGKPIEWLAAPVKNKVKVNNKWMEVSETFKIPINTARENILKLYVWNPTKDEVLLDDFNVTFH